MVYPNFDKEEWWLVAQGCDENLTRERFEDMWEKCMRRQQAYSQVLMED